MKFWLKLLFFKLGLRHLLQRGKTWINFYLGKPHEPEFQFFKNLPETAGLFVDIGANAGQSALSFRIFNKPFKIISFEPNQLMKSDLSWAKKLLGGSFEFQLLGFHNQGRTTAKLYVPHVHGYLLTQEATMDQNFLKSDQLTMDRIQSAIAGFSFQVLALDMQFEKFDNLGLSPDVIKIDVQGQELNVLKGMESCLKTKSPLLMLENSLDFAPIRVYLKNMGYQAFYYLPDQNRLVSADLPDNPQPVIFFLQSNWQNKLSALL